MPVKLTDFLQDPSGATDRQRAVASILLRAARRHAKSPEYVPEAALTRSTIPDTEITDEDLKGAGFLRSYVAVPEAGQSRLATYRHPMNGLHFHKHPRMWMFHEDTWPSLQMVMKKYEMEHPGATRTDKLKFMLTQALPQSYSHAVNEGLPGYMSWTVGRIMGTDGITGTGRIDPLRAIGGVGTLAAAIGAGQKLSTGEANMYGNTGGILGLAGGHYLSKAIYRKLADKYEFFKHPSTAATGLLVGLPLLTSYLGYKAGTGIGNMRKTAGIYTDLAMSWVGEHRPGKHRVANAVGSLYGSLSSDIEHADQQGGLNFMPGYGRANIERQRRLLSRRMGNPHDKGTAMSERYGGYIAGIAPALLLGVATKYAANKLGDDMGGYGGWYTKQLGKYYAAPIVAAAGTAMIPVGASLLALCTPRRSSEEQMKYERGSKLHNWLVPGAGRYNRLKAYGYIHGQQIEDELQARGLKK